MKSNSDPSSSKLDRKTIEKNRRIHMKHLCFKLASVIPSSSNHFNNSKAEMLSQQDLLDHAASYIKQLRERMEELKARKEVAAMNLQGLTNANNITDDDNTMATGSRLPSVELMDFGCSLELVLISGLKKNFMLHEVISVLEEGGAEVVTCSYSTVGDNVFHSLHAQVKICRVGVDTSWICERLQEIIFQNCR